MPEPEIERRHSARLPRAIDVMVRTKDGAQHQCVTRDISSGGIFFYCPAALVENSSIDLLVALPPELNAGTTHWVRARATVIRVEGSDGPEQGVAAKVELFYLLSKLNRAAVN